MNTQTIKKIAVIGAGAMGGGIAQVGILAGFSVAMRDIEQRFVDKGLQTITASMDKFAAKGKITAEQYQESMARLRPTLDLAEAVQDADLIVEAAPEIMDLKQRILREVDALAPAHAIIASNTSSMSITELARATARPQQVVGMHFSNPAVLMKLVEVIRTTYSSEEAVQAVAEVARQMKKVAVIVQKDSPGFIYNRVNAPTALFLFRVLERGTPTPEEFDAAFKPFMPMAPFELSDFVGLDIAYHTQLYYSQTLSEDYAPPKTLSDMVQAGTLGMKSGRGVYDWSAGRPVIDISKATKDFDLNHMIALQVNEGSKLLEEGVAESVKEIDLAMANGGGGIGPFTLGQGIGWEVLVQKCNELADMFEID